MLTSGTCDGKLKLWNANSGALISTTSAPREQDCGYKGTGTRFYAGVTATNPDGTIVAQAEANGTVQLLDSHTGRLLRTLPGGHAGVQAIRFDRTGARLATGNWDGTAIVWDTRSGAPVQTLASQEGIVESVAFSPDGRTLATAGEDATAELWDIATGTRLLTLTGHSFALTDVAFSPDGSRLATSSGDGTVRIYVLPVGAAARRRIPPPHPRLDAGRMPNLPRQSELPHRRRHARSSRHARLKGFGEKSRSGEMRPVIAGLAFARWRGRRGGRGLPWPVGRRNLAP